MNEINIGLSIVSVIGTISSICFAYIACKRTNMQTQKAEGKSEGTMSSDIGYIKACVERVEKNLTIVDERYRTMAEKVAKLEESMNNITKRVDEIYKVEGG